MAIPPNLLDLVPGFAPCRESPARMRGLVIAPLS